MGHEGVRMFPSTSLSLGAEARSTPLDDLENVVAMYQPRVFRFLLATLRDRDAAETLTQETFLRAWSARESFREDCSLATWLIRIALNLARDHTRTGRFRFWKRVSASAVDVADVAASVPAHDRSAEAQLIAQQQVGASGRRWPASARGNARSFCCAFWKRWRFPRLPRLRACRWARSRATFTARWR